MFQKKVLLLFLISILLTSCSVKEELDVEEQVSLSFENQQKRLYDDMVNLKTQQSELLALKNLQIEADDPSSLVPEILGVAHAMLDTMVMEYNAQVSLDESFSVRSDKLKAVLLRDMSSLDDTSVQYKLLNNAFDLSKDVDSFVSLQKEGSFEDSYLIVDSLKEDISDREVLINIFVEESSKVVSR